jgi:hypothetical protein
MRLTCLSGYLAEEIDTGCARRDSPPPGRVQPGAVRLPSADGADHRRRTQSAGPARSINGPLAIRSCDSVVKPMNMVGAVTLVRQSVKATPHVTAMIGSMHAHDCSADHGDEH